LTLRPIAAEDREFLCRLYASTRAEELALTDWSEERKEAFLRQQFEAQHSHYQQHYAGASFDLVVVDGEPAGRLYVDRSPQRWHDEIRLVDIALLPEHRGRGLGRRLLGELIEEARSAGRRLTIHVEMFNPALRLYERLGFRPISQYGIYHLMEWRADSPVEATLEG
jgi:GNAT superfamily N-acetyltransferase